MSKISTVYDTVLSTLATLYPSKKRIINTESLQDNPVQFLRDSYGLRMDGQTLQPSEFKIIEGVNVFTVILSREVIRTDSQTTQIDDQRKLLLEDVHTLEKDFYNADRLGIPTSIARIEPTGRSGILELQAGKNNFIFVEVFFNVHIREDL